MFGYGELPHHLSDKQHTEIYFVRPTVNSIDFQRQVTGSLSKILSNSKDLKPSELLTRQAR